MSRIYDALQRAKLERGDALGTDAAQAGDPLFASRVEDLPPVANGVNLEKIARYPWNPSIPTLPSLEDRSDGIEQFRGLRSQIYQLDEQTPLKTILISSGIPSEGKSFVAANLAISLASNKKTTTLLIDADLRRPSQHRILGAPNGAGLTEYLAGDAKPEEIMQRIQTSRVYQDGRAYDVPNLTFIPAGAGGDNSSELIANHRIEELIAILSPHFDWILIDSPPVLTFSDAIDLAHAADAVMLVARAYTTPFDVARRAQASFCNSRMIGFVLNAVKDIPLSASYYYGRPEVGGSHPRKDKGQ